MAQKYDIICCALKSFSILIGLINNDDDYIFSLLQIFIRCACLRWEHILSVSWSHQSSMIIPKKKLEDLVEMHFPTNFFWFSSLCLGRSRSFHPAPHLNKILKLF